MRLIDADALPKLLDAEYKQTMKLIREGEKHLDTLAEGFAEAMHIAKYIAPTVDAVPVVRCKDCKPVVEPVQPLTAQAAPKPMTNGDRIRAMTDEELIAAFGGRICDVIPAEDCPGMDHTCCHSCLIKWLGSPEKEAAPEPVTNGDRIQDMKDGELEERERLERLFEEARQIADRRAWDETPRTMADSCGQEANDE